MGKVNENIIRTLLNEITVKDAYDQHYREKGISETDYQKIVNFLQGTNEVLDQYTKWALEAYLLQPSKFMRDLHKLHDSEGKGYLDIYKRAKLRGMLDMRQLNLSNYKTIVELEELVNSLNHDEVFALTKKEMSRAVNAAKNDIIKQYEDENWFVVTPKSYEASCYWGNGTEWCTATRSMRDHYDHLTKQGKLYININKKTKEKYQFHFPTEQFMDCKDKDIKMPIFETMGNADGLREFYRKEIGDIDFMDRPFRIKSRKNDGCYVVQDDETKLFNYIDSEDNLLLDFWVNVAYPFRNGYALFFKNGKVNYTDTKGNLVSKIWFAKGSMFQRDGYSIVLNSDKQYNILNRNGELMLEQWYRRIYAKVRYLVPGFNYYALTEDGKTKRVFTTKRWIKQKKEKSSGKRFRKLFKEEVIKNGVFLTEISVKDAYDRYYREKGVSETDYQKIISSLQGDNDILLPETKWALELYKRKSPRFMEDLYKLHSEDGKGYIDIFKRARERRMLPAGTDMGKFKSISELEAFINTLDVNEILGITKGELSRNIRSAKDDIEVLYEDSEWIVLIPKTYEASCHWGSGTEWCTATRNDPEHYEAYIEDGPLYININKITGDKYQFHFETDSFKDASDEEINKPVFETIDASEGLIEFYKKHLPKETFIHFDYNTLWEGYGIYRYSSFTENGLINMVDEKGNVIEGPFEAIESFQLRGDRISGTVCDPDEGYNAIDVDGNLLSNNWFDYNCYPLVDDIVAGANAYMRWNIYKQGKLVVEDTFLSVECLPGRNAKIATVKRGNGEYNHLNLKTGEYLLDKWLKFAEPFRSNSAIIELNDYEFYLINDKGEIITPQYHYIHRTYFLFPETIKYMVYDEHHKHNYLDENGNLLFDKWFCRDVDRIDGTEVFTSSYHDFVNGEWKCIPCKITGVGIIEPLDEFVNEMTLNDVKYIIHEAARQLINEITVKDAQEIHYKDIPEDVFTNIIQKVQGENNIMLPITRWILSIYKKGGENRELLMNTLPKLRTEDRRGYLDIWERAVIRNVINGNDADLTKYKNFKDWINKVESFDVNQLFQRTNGEWSKAVNAARTEINRIYEDDEWLVVQPLTMEAACYWGNGCEWCTAARNENNYFDDYNDEGPLYINIKKGGDASDKYQFSLVRSEYKNYVNEDVYRPVLDDIGASKGMKEKYKELAEGNEQALFELFYNQLDEDDYVYVDRINNQFAVVKKEINGEQFMIPYSNWSGFVGDTWYKWVDNIDEHLTFVRVYTKNNMYNLLDLETGDIISPANYERIEQFREWETGEFYDNYYIFYSLIYKGDKVGLLTYNERNNRLYYPNKFFKHIGPPYSENYGLFKVKDFDDEVAYMDINGEIIGDYYERINDFDGETAMVVKDGMYNFMDMEGNLTEEWEPLY